MSVGMPIPPSLLPAGVPCWIELASANEQAARDFYGELFGWEFFIKRDPATVNRRYTIAVLHDLQAGGLYQAASDQPTGWMVHLAVGNTVNTAEWVQHLGGTITLGPVDIPDRGSILHAVDPSGAPVVFWQPPGDWSFATSLPGSFTGADLNTHDGPSADQFYCRLFEFTSQQIGQGGIDYVEWRLDHEPVLYRYAMDPSYQATVPPHWMIYFEADPARGTDAIAGQALMLGGNVVTAPFDTPFGRTAVLADPGGAVFSIVDHSRPVDTGVGKAEVDDPYDD
ncbi:glyoxalase [Prauserella sp. PE36]|uniref:VOC family protein n=1 Tax=Prauserella endophytica TaxID=1592324 RepID=A0ABY2S727_9PSEU|nr:MULTISPECIES: VOC family protein [Prauserella]PXY26166.1 glyoxalase [Prauserella coralliicola]RBM19982.1 glyoxalase [Prauserella sp. PE36]TKG71387.1 VOC family protein [Prauserella endophytica]